MLRRNTQHGVVLIVVLWVVALLTILLAAFVATIKVERQSVADVSLGIQARAATEGVLNYMAALTAVAAPELEEMPGQRYELTLNELSVSFRLLPESLFVPVNTLDVTALESVLAGMGLDNAAELAERVVELRSEGLDEATGEVRPALQFRSLMQLAHVLELDVEHIRPYERWLSFWGMHEQVIPGYVPDAVLDALGLAIGLSRDTDVEAGIPWEPAAVYRVQVEIAGGLRPRQMEAIASFVESGYSLLHINEYNAVFSLNDLSE